MLILSAALAVCGTLLAATQSGLPEPLRLLGLLTLVGLASLYGRRYALPVLVLLVFYAWATLFFFLSQAQQHRFGSAIDNVLIEGRVSGLVQHRERYSRWQFELAESTRELHPHLPKKIRLTGYSLRSRPEAGEFWRFQVRLRPWRGYWNPVGFDQQIYALSKGMPVTGYVQRSVDNQRLQQPDPWSLLALRQSLRESLLGQLESELGRALVLALSLGDRSFLSAEMRQTLVATGTLHLLAISGLHIGLVATLGWWLGSGLWRALLWRWCHNRYWAATVTAWLLAAGYAALAGFSLPTQRALIMLSVFSFFLWRRRSIDLPATLSWSLLFILLWDPFSVLSWSFWLSFGAIVIILLSLFRLPARARWWHQWLGIQTGFFVFLFPVSVWLGNEASLSAWPANLLAIPWVSLVALPLVLLGLLVGPWPTLQGAVLWAAEQSLTVLMHFLAWLQQAIPGVALPYLSTLQILLILLGLFMFLILPQRAWRFASLVLILLPLWPQQSPLKPGDWRAHMLDVGQGTGVLIETAHHVLAYDMGPGNRHGYATALWIQQPMLQRLGFSRPDAIVLSHDDQDHVGGLYALEEAYKDLPVWSGQQPASQKRFPALQQVRTCHQGDRWDWDGVIFRFVSIEHPATATVSDNNGSCVLQIVGREHRLLLTGDIERGQERQLLEHWGAEALRSDAMLVPHHGSASSSSTAWIKAIKPSLALVSSGHLNRWGFPREAVSSRYRDSGARLLNTATEGYWRITSSDSQLQTQSWSQEQPRWWRQHPDR